jgi:hypothetical protein
MLYISETVQEKRDTLIHTFYCVLLNDFHTFWLHFYLIFSRHSIIYLAWYIFL